MLPSSAQTTSQSLYCTRALVLVLAIIITAANLFIYSTHTKPLFSLFSSDQYHDPSFQTPFHRDDSSAATVMLQMIQDRRLISTLVASQASVFCPLFLLLTNRRQKQDVGLSLEQLLCQLFMPAGLAVSWVFSILFDLKAMSALHPDASPMLPRLQQFLLPQQQDMCLFDRSSNEGLCRVVNAVHYLKYAIILVLIADLLLVLYSGLASFCEQMAEGEGFIRLDDDEEQGRKYHMSSEKQAGGDPMFSYQQQQPQNDEQQRIVFLHAQALL